MTPKKAPAPAPLTRKEQRLLDNARPLGELDPSLCAMQADRPAFDRSHNCLVCAYRWNEATTHCHLYETCDRCHDEANPCDTAQQLGQFAKQFRARPQPVSGHDA